MKVHEMSGVAGGHSDKAGHDGRSDAPARNASPAGGGAVYGLGMIGALAYFVADADSPRGYGLAFLKAMVWPAFLVYRAFRRLGE